MSFRTMILLFLCSIGMSITTKAQQWTKGIDGTYQLSKLRYQEVADMVQGPDSAYYFITRYQGEKYWRKRGKGELMVSRIDGKGNIAFITSLNRYMKKPRVRFAGNRYFIMDDDHYDDLDLCVYDPAWHEINVTTIPRRPHQSGIEAFYPQPDGTVFLLTRPYSGWKTPLSSNYILKVVPDGTVETMPSDDSTRFANLTIHDDRLYFTRRHFLPSHRRQWDTSIEQVHCNKCFKREVVESRSISPKQEIFQDTGTTRTYSTDTISISENHKWQLVSAVTNSDGSLLQLLGNGCPVTQWQLQTVDLSGHHAILKTWTQQLPPGATGPFKAGIYYFPKERLVWLYYTVEPEALVFARIQL